MSAAGKLPPARTVAEFFDWIPSEGGDRWDLVDGTPRAMALASPRHGGIQGESARLLANQLNAARPDWQVLIEPDVRPRVRAAHNIRLPDPAVGCGTWVGDDRVLAEPLVPVEILSPSNDADTWTNVWSHTTIPSVPEILVLHTAEARADLPRQQAAGRWPADRRTLRAADVVALDSIGFTAPLSAFYRTSGTIRL
jgi:Uma2 family endonuclease